MKIKIVFGENGKKDRYFIDGQEVSKKEFKKRVKPKPIGTGEGLVAWKTLVSDALAVHPDQVEEAIADAKKKGVATEFQPDGRPVFTSRNQYNAYLRAYGFYNRDAGYGDTTRGSFRGTTESPKQDSEY